MNGPFTAPADNILDGQGQMSGNGFVFYAAKTARMNDDTYLCGWLGRAGLSGDSGVYQWAGNVLNHQLVQHEDKTLGVDAPETYADYFTADKPFQAVKKEGGVKISDNNITLSPKDDVYALADMGTRPASVLLECDVTLDGDGRVGFAFGGSEKDPSYTALCLDASRDQIHYEGYEIEDLRDMDPVALTRFAFKDSVVHHVKLVCENEIVVLYIDSTKALSCRISHSTDGAHICVFADGCGASFQNITMKLPG
jgi:beta-fructofuranosidase